MSSMTYIVSVIGMESWNCTQSQKDFIDQKVSEGSKWIIMPNGKSFAVHSLQSITPRYSMKEWTERNNKTNQVYLEMVKPAMLKNNQLKIENAH